MKCFYEPSADAIGLCKSCGRGLSSEYLTDMGKGLACKDRCENDVSGLITMINRSVASTDTTNQILRRSSLTGYGSSVFLSVMGLIFTVTGLRDPRMDFTLYLGIGFLAYSLWTFIRVRRYAALVAKLADATDGIK